MTIIIGLGNPGKKYINTRHNIGFRTVNQFLEENNFPQFKLSNKFYSLVSEGSKRSRKIILVQPQTFMNNSGKAVKKLINFYKPANLVIIHDDIDLLLGKIKVARNRGSAGHKGVESIIKEIGKDFTRIRIGIRPHNRKPKAVDRFVLQKFNPKDNIKKTIEETVKILEEII